MRPTLLLAALLLSGACTTYEYEEEVFLEVDGSGRIRVSGSREILESLHELDEASSSAVEALLRGMGVEIVSVRETEREGRWFVHVQARFRDWNDLCGRPLFERRRCRLAMGVESVELALSFPPARRPAAEGVDPASEMALRFHVPGRVHHHNSPEDVGRGNILSWKRTVREHFGGNPLEIEARFDRRSVLAATMRVLAFAAGVVVLAVGGALTAMYRKGRRQLEADAERELSSASRPARP